MCSYTHPSNMAAFSFNILSFSLLLAEICCGLLGENGGEEDKKIRIRILISIVCMPFMCSLRLCVSVCVYINDKSIHSQTAISFIRHHKHQHTACVPVPV